MIDDTPQDVRYAYMQLGLADGATAAQIQTVLRNAKAYRYRTKARIALLEELVRFFAARARFGVQECPFADIRRAYHNMALVLHPDRNLNNRAAEEKLKTVNTHFALVEKINRAAKAYYKLPPAEQQGQAELARQARMAERPADAAPEPESEPMPQPQAKARPAPAQRTYMAAAVPRAMRQSRLGYLPLNCLLGSLTGKGPRGENRIFDIVMLPAKEFMRMKSYIGLQHLVAPELKLGSFQPGFVVRDVRTVIVPAGESAPEEYAKALLMKQFGIRPE